MLIWTSRRAAMDLAEDIYRTTKSTQTWYVSVAMACATVFGVVWIEWKSVKGKKLEPVAA